MRSPRICVWIAISTLEILPNFNGESFEKLGVIEGLVRDAVIAFRVPRVGVLELCQCLYCIFGISKRWKSEVYFRITKFRIQFFCRKG